MAMDNGYADGSIVVDTTIDSSGFKAGSDKLKRAVDSLAASFDKIGSKVQTALDGDTTSMRALEREAAKLEEQIKKNEAEMEKLGNTRFTTKYFEDLSKEVDKADKKLRDLYTKRDRLKALGVSEQSQSWKGLVYDIKEAERYLNNLEKQQARMKDSGSAYEMGYSTEKYAQMSSELSGLVIRLAEVKGKLADAKAQAQATADDANARAKELNRTIRNGILKGLQMIGKTGFASFSLLAKGAKAAAGHIKDIAFHSKAGQNSVKALSKTLTGFFAKLKSRIYRKLITSVYSGIVQGIKSLVTEFPELNASISAIVSSLGYLKNSFATAFAPLINLVAPALSKAIDLLGDLFTHIGMVVSALTGATSFKQAVKVQKDYAASLNETTKAANSAKKALAGFDQLNNNTSSDSSSGGSTAETLFKDVPISGGIADFAKKIRNAFLKGNYAEIGTAVAGKINGIFKKINTAITNATPRIGKAVNGIIDIFNSLVDSIDWEQIGTTVGNGFNLVIDTIHRIITRTDWSNLGSKLATGLNGLIATIDWTKLGATIGGGLTAALNFLKSAVTTFDWVQFGSSIGDAIEGLRKSFSFTSVGETAAATLTGIFKALHQIIKKTNFKAWAKDLTNGLNTFIEKTDWKELGETLGDSFTGVIDFVYTAIDEFDEKKAAKALYDTFNNFIEKVNWNELGKAISTGAVKALNFIAEMLEGINWEGVGESVAEFLNGIDFSGILKGIWNILLGIVKAIPALIKGIVTNIDFETGVSIIATAFGLLFLKDLLAYFTTAVGAAGLFGKIKTALTSKLTAGAAAEGGIGMTLGSKICAGVAAFMAGWKIGSWIYEKWIKDFNEEFTYPVLDALGLNEALGYHVNNDDENERKARRAVNKTLYGIDSDKKLTKAEINKAYGEGFEALKEILTIPFPHQAPYTTIPKP